MQLCESRDFYLFFFGMHKSINTLFFFLVNIHVWCLRVVHVLGGLTGGLLREKDRQPASEELNRD